MEDTKRPCNNFFKTGYCSYHEKCSFSHTITDKFVQSAEIANVLRKMGLEIKKIETKPKKNIIPDFSSEVDFPAAGKKKTSISKLIQTEMSTMTTQTEISDDKSTTAQDPASGCDNSYNNGYNDGIADLSEKVLGDFLHRQETINMLGQNGYIHLYLSSNIKSISNALQM